MVPGELTIITGVPNSGKSEWIDALMVNLASKFGWRFGLCSMEKKVSLTSSCFFLHCLDVTMSIITSNDVISYIILITSNGLNDYRLASYC